VIAVEPVPEMRAKLAQTSPGAQAVDGTAERLPLPDGAADVITAAQAFHWFDADTALPELHRVLTPTGHLVLLWNSRDLNDPLQAALEDVLAPLRGAAIGQQAEGWRGPLDRSPLFGELEERRFRLEQQLTVEALCDRVRSTSFVASMTPVDREALLVEVRALAHGLPEPFAFRYVTEVYVIPRSSDRASIEGGTSIEG
jgi:SAM-dependent methyltransferase